MLISLCTRDAFCLPQLSCLCHSCECNVAFRKHNELERLGETKHSSPFICARSPSILLSVMVIVASR